MGCGSHGASQDSYQFLAPGHTECGGQRALVRSTL
jgi:hypothetical protein